MGQLSRTTRSLLRKVKNVPHATEDDHDDTTPQSRPTKRRTQQQRAPEFMPTPPKSNSKSRLSSPTEQTMTDQTDEDIDRDPCSDDCEPESLPRKRKAASRVRHHHEGHSTTAASVEDGAELKLLSSKGSTSKEKRAGISDEHAVEDAALFEQMDNVRRRKKQKTGHLTSTFDSVHAHPTSGFVTPKADATYGKQKPKREPEFQNKAMKLSMWSSPPGKKGYKTPKTLETQQDEGPKFQIRGLDLDIMNRETSGVQDEGEALSDEEELKAPVTTIVEARDTISDDPMTECTHCGERVDKFLQEEYEDTYNQGKELTFKWQRRFCEHHRRHRARSIWRERRYPDIDWSDLETRMLKHDAFLLDILKCRASSTHRDALQEKLKPRRRNLQQAMTSADRSRPGASVGYYGPKGERVMMDHIVTSLSDELRSRAGKDKVVASSGVQGGVSGYVQSVLVPHIAELLIKEDMGLSGKDWLARARIIITESAEIGELLNPAAEDHIEQKDEDDDDA